MTAPLNLAVIGAGRIGSLHARHLAGRVPGARLLAISDVNIDAARRSAAECGVSAAYDDPQSILEDPAIEAVLICSSTDTHAVLIEQAAAAGKHIFCEKPIAYDLPTIDRALTAVDSAGVKLQIGFNRRFDPAFRQAREVLASGQIGAPELLRITSRDPQPPPLDYIRSSGGLFLDMAIHDFDMARFLTADEVVSVYAAGGVLVDPAIGAAGDIDTAITTLRFGGGAIGAIDNSRRAVYGYDQRVEVFGAGGAIMVGNLTPHTAVLSDAQGVHAARPLFFFVERYIEAYIAELHAFVECIRRDTLPPVTGHDGRMPVVMALAAARSLAEGRAVALREVDPLA
jgi:myo-inositol 2-dehydrogenase/D-chiro-inositol 1-dehydrogenase